MASPGGIEPLGIAGLLQWGLPGNERSTDQGQADVASQAAACANRRTCSSHVLIRDQDELEGSKFESKGTPAHPYAHDPLS
jgi:hypothetical protein